MKYFKSILIATFLISFIACDKLIEEIANDNTVLLTTNVWTFDSLTGFDVINNLFESVSLIGATYQFIPDGTYIAVIPTQPPNGTWEFNADKTVITLDPGTSGAVEWSVVTLNETELKITYADVRAQSGIVTITFN